MALLLGDASKARIKLDREHRHTLEDLVEEMMIAALAETNKDTYLLKNGFTVDQ